MLVKKLTVLLLLVFGLWQISSSCYMLAKAHLSQYLIINAWKKTLDDNENHMPWSWADTYPVFEIVIPRLDKNSIVLEGASGRNMAFSAAHSYESGMPGKNKSTIVSGHRDSHFKHLQYLSSGDEIIINTVDKSHAYQVAKIEIVDSDIESLYLRNRDEIILTTCYPFDALQTGGSLRFVVYANPVI